MDVVCGARTLCNVWFPQLLDELLDVYEKIYDLGNRANVYDKLKKLLAIFSKTSTFERSLFKPLLYIKQHTAYLRHMANLSNFHKDVKTTIEYLADLVVLFCRLTEYSSINLKKCAAVTRSFYMEYHSFAVLNKIEVLTIEALDSALIEDGHVETMPEPPPQHCSIDWYRKNGHRDFMKKCIVVPDGGIWKDRRCKILRYNGNNTQCMDIESGEVKLLSSKGYTIFWIYDPTQNPGI